MRFIESRSSRRLQTIAVFGIALALGTGRLPAQAPAQVDPEAVEPVQAEPEAAPPKADLGEAGDLVREGKYAEAEPLLAALHEAHPEDADLRLMHGEVLLALGRAEEALEHLERAAALDPTLPRVNFQLATALATTGDADGAIEAFAREIDLNDEQEVVVMARLNRSLLYQQQSDWAAAAAELDQALTLDPSRPEAYGDLASLHLRAGQTGQAEQALEQGAARGFGSAEHYYSLAARMYSDGNYTKSVETLKECLEIDPEMAKAERSLAAALEKTGREDEALTHLRRYLELAPDAPDAPRVRERLAAPAGD